MLPETELTPYIQSRVEELASIYTGGLEEDEKDQKAAYFFRKFLKTAFLMEEADQQRLVEVYAKHIAGVSALPNWKTDTHENLRRYLTEVGKRLNIGDPISVDGVSFWKATQREI